MFEILLTRHAKSDWNSHTSDIDRPLNSRGVEDALHMSDYLNSINLRPDKIVASPASRAHETARLLATNMPIAEQDIIIDKELYLADRDTLCEHIELYAAENYRLMLVAHNPGMDDLVSYLSSSPPPLSITGKLMTTCTVACFQIDSLDALKKSGQGILQNIIRPKEISGAE